MLFCVIKQLIKKGVMQSLKNKEFIPTPYTFTE